MSDLNLESEGQRRVEWQAGDMRLVVDATTNKVMGVERRFEDADGSEYWRDAPNWPADALAQALVDSNVLARKFSPAAVAARTALAKDVTELEQGALWALERDSDLGARGQTPCSNG